MKTRQQIIEHLSDPGPIWPEGNERDDYETGYIAALKWVVED
jgi:hypothetical protein